MLRHKVLTSGMVGLVTMWLEGCGGGGLNTSTGTLGSISNPSSPSTTGSSSSGWSSPRSLYTANNLPNSGAQSPMMAADAQGDLVAAWLQGMDVNGDIGVFVSRYQASTSTWSTPLQVDTTSRLGISASSPALVMDSAGNATLAWIQNTAQQIPALWAVHFSVFNAVVTPPAKVDQSLSTGAGSSQPVLSVEGADQAVVAWMQDEGTGNYVKLSAYTNGVWSIPQDVASPVSQIGSPSSPQVTSDASGHVTLVWLQPLSNGSLSVAARQWQQSTFTSTLAYVDTLTLPGNGASAPLAVTDSAGHVDVVWIQGVNNASTGIVPSLYSSVLAAGATQWSAPQEVDSSAGSGGSGHAQMLADTSGNAWVVWEQATAGLAPMNHLYVKAVSASGVWVSPTLINSGVLFPSGVGVTAGPLLTIDNMGNQNVSWVTSDPPMSSIPVVYNSQHKVSIGLWTAPTQVNTTGYYAQGVSALATAVAPSSGVLYALWTQFNGMQNQIFYSQLP